MSDLQQQILKLTVQFFEKCSAANLNVTVAESCTGGLLCAALTEVAGSSAIFERGFVTYSNDAKTQMLGVDAKQIETHGAVSAEVATEMAKGALIKAKAGLAIAVTGIAGPGGGSAEKLVGLVYISLASASASTVETYQFGALDRAVIRQKTVEAALKDALAFLDRNAHSSNGAS